MKRILILAGLILLVAIPATGRAQCAVGCVSSSSCDGTGKAGCKTACDGSGACGCTDTVCGTQLRPSLLGASEGTGALLLARAEVPRLVPALLVDCHGNILDVRLLDGNGVSLLDDLVTIRLRRTEGAPTRVATRE
jgi:hypothetical protein